MKPGFLNTGKAKRALEESTTSHDNIPNKEKAAISSNVDAAKAPLPRLNLHSIPKSIKAAMNYPVDKKRFIFRHWPRDPKGKPILPSDIHGKEAGNGLDLWGATLYDFYFVRRLPNNPHALTISTGSKLKKVMEAFGELQHAKDELAWAAREEEPKEILPWDPAQAIEAYERRILSYNQPGSTSGSDEGPPNHPSMSSHDYNNTADVDMIDGEAEPPTCVPELESSSETTADIARGENVTHVTPASNNDTAQQCPESASLPFHPHLYPSPWPFAPFEAPYTPFTLHRRIPIHLLPKKLHVHDPWNLLQVLAEDDDGTIDGEDTNDAIDADQPWNSKKDNVMTYTLSLPPEAREAANEAQKAAIAAEDELLKHPESVTISPQSYPGPTMHPAIRAILPQRPRKLTEVPEAHLYLSPKGALGFGHHSVVLTAEWELPRDLFCESIICDDCLEEQVRLEVARLKKSGEWWIRLEEAMKSQRYRRNRDEMETSSGPTGKDSSTTTRLPNYKPVGFVRMKVQFEPMETIDLVPSKQFDGVSAADAPSHSFVPEADVVINRIFEYEGPIVSVYPDIKWQTPSIPSTICAHQAQNFDKRPVPPTAVFRVAAKLSVPDDLHLSREANNYLKFPDHFFQHWSGYNVVPPLHDPTPVGALVPQFFGYYTCHADFQPEDQYLSPILLIEHCGQPISIEDLSIDDRHECAALLFRFHDAGWMHESFAERNIVMQKGQPTRNPLEKHDGDRPHSFRLIDFGRSTQFTGNRSSPVEEMEGKKLFGLI